MDESQNIPGESVEAAAPESSSQENVVPVHVVQSLRNENQQLKQNMQMVSEHLELLKANQMQQQSPRQDQFNALSDHDVLTVGDAKKVLGQMERKREMETQELKMSQSYPDYSETIKTYLPQVLKEDPELRAEIENAKNPYKMAYMLAKKSSKFVEEQRAKNKSEDAERILANSQKTGNLSAMGTQSPITKSSYVKSMSDEDFRKLMNKNSSRY